MSEGGVTEVYFYHLERRTLEDVLPTLLERSLERGWRAAVQAASEERVEALDTLLWTYREESFLAARHGARRSRGGSSNLPHRPATTIPTARRSASWSTARRSTMPRLTPASSICSTGATTSAVARARAEWQKAKTQGFSVSYLAAG